MDATIQFNDLTWLI